MTEHFVLINCQHFLSLISSNYLSQDYDFIFRILPRTKNSLFVQYLPVFPDTYIVCFIPCYEDTCDVPVPMSALPTDRCDILHSALYRAQRYLLVSTY
jgi:hypothetical protein